MIVWILLKAEKVLPLENLDSKALSKHLWTPLLTDLKVPYITKTAFERENYEIEFHFNEKCLSQSFCLKCNWLYLANKII